MYSFILSEGTIVVVIVPKYFLTVDMSRYVRERISTINKPRPMILSPVMVMYIRIRKTDQERKTIAYKRAPFFLFANPYGMIPSERTVSRTSTHTMISLNENDRNKERFPTKARESTKKKRNRKSRRTIKMRNNTIPAGIFILSLISIKKCQSRTYIFPL